MLICLRVCVQIVPKVYVVMLHECVAWDIMTDVFDHREY